MVLRIKYILLIMFFQDIVDIDGSQSGCSNVLAGYVCLFVMGIALFSWERNGINWIFL